MPLTLEDFAADKHAATYVSKLKEHPEATAQLLAVLNHEHSEQKLVLAEELGRPALAGVVGVVEGIPDIAEVLSSGASGHRFRQAVGVAVRLKMEQLGWTKASKKGSVPNAVYFTKAERFTH